MACDPGGGVRPQEPLPAVALDVDVLEQHRRSLLVDAPVQARLPQRRRRRLHAAASPGGGAVVLGTPVCLAPAQLGAAVMLPRRAPTGEEEQVGVAAGKHALARTAEGSSGETSGPVTALLLNSNKNGGGSFSKEALGRICICNGPAASATTLLLLLHHTGPVEQIQIQGGHGTPASFLLGTHEEPLLHYVPAAGFSLGDGRPLLALEIAPRVSVEWPLITSVDDLLSYQHVMVHPSLYSPIVSLLISSIECIFQRKITTKVRDMNATEMLLRGDADVHEVNAIVSIALPSITQEPRTAWLLLKKVARILQENTHGPIHMAALQNMCFNLNSASMIVMIPWYGRSSPQKNQARSKEGGDWLLYDEFDDFILCYSWSDASAGLVSSNFSAGVAMINSKCYLKQGSKLVPQDPKADETSIGEVDYRDAKEGGVVLLLRVVDGNTSAPACVVVEGVSKKRSICNSVVDEALSTQHASSRDSNERSEVRDMNPKMLLRGDADVNKVNAIGSTQKPRTAWLLLKHDARVFKGNTDEPIHMAASQNMCFKQNSASMIPWDSTSLQVNRVLSKKGGDRLLDDELDDFNRCTVPHASAGLASSNFSAQVAMMKSQCALKQGSKSAPQKHDNMSQIFVGCFPSSLDSAPAEYHTKFLTAELGHLKALVIGLKRENQMQSQGITFIQSEREKGVVNAKEVGKIVNAEDTDPSAPLPAEFQMATSHSILDGGLSKEHNFHQWCIFLVQYLPSFFVFRKWLPGLSVFAAAQLRERYPLSLGDVRARCIMKLSHGVHGYHKPRDSIQILPGACNMCAVSGRNNLTTHIVHLPPLSQPKGELKELKPDFYQYPISPVTTNITGDSHDAENQQVDACSESNIQRQQGNGCRLSVVDSHQDGDSADNDSLVVPIFLRHASGELVLMVSVNQCLQHLMQMYTEKTKMKLDCQYFVYGRKILEADHTLLFYGVKRDTTVHVCTRLLGGMVTIQEYLINKERFLTEVTLPDGRVSLEMTKEGCLFLSTWLKCFTKAFADSKSWNGNFTLKDFKVVNGHVRVITVAKEKLISSSMHADLVKLVSYIKTIFFRKELNLISNFPPYLENLTTFLESLKYPTLLDEDRLFIETHMCCVESAARGLFLVWLRREYKSLRKSEQRIWDKEMNGAKEIEDYVSFGKLSSIAVFKDIIARVQNSNEPYTGSKQSTLRLMRDEFMHGPSNRFDKSAKTWREKFKNDDGIELMIPAYNKDLIPNILENWIKSKRVDIKSLLLAVQVRCTCPLCHSSHSGSTGGGESSAAGKGKQPVPAASSSGSSQPSSPAQAATNPWFASSGAGGRSLLERIRSSPSPTLQSSSSSRLSSPSSQDAKGKGKQGMR